MNKDKYSMIKYYLYNYNILDELIKIRKNEIIDETNISINDWLEKEKNIADNQYIKLNNDKKIIEIRKWKAFINRMLIFLSKNSFISYIYIKLKYFEKKTDYEISESLEINFNDLYVIKGKLIDWIYKNAKMRNLIWNMRYQIMFVIGMTVEYLYEKM